MRDPPEGDPEVQRRRLELEKLRLDIKYVPRVFVAQIANTLVVACLAVLVLYLFQKPQLEQMRRNQEASEKQQIMSLLIAAQSVSDEKDRSRIVEALSHSFPENKLLRSFAESNRVLATLGYIRADGKIVNCESIRSDMRRLRREVEWVKIARRQEIEGASGGPSGYGPAARLLDEQQQRLLAKMKQLESEDLPRRCLVE